MNEKIYSDPYIKFECSNCKTKVESYFSPDLYEYDADSDDYYCEESCPKCTKYTKVYIADIAGAWGGF